MVAPRPWSIDVTKGLGPLAILTVLIAATPAAIAQEGRRPNILWLSSEDNGPHLGAYGDRFADTPNLDALASRGLRYEVAWSNAPVCAPARTTIITGLYATSIGAHHMRSEVRLPAGFKLFPEILHNAGYYTSNNSKLDYNLAEWGANLDEDTSRRVWNETSTQAHWRARPAGAPFFSVFNYTITHESRIRSRPHEAKHDPAGVTLPAYHPDTPEVRRDWAQYYDKMTEMDAMAGAHLRQLEEDGLAGETIVFYWGDHGIGLPRGKRTPLDSGLRVPLLLYIPPAFRHLAPEDYQPGGVTDRLVSFVDFAATVLSLAGVEPPEHYQGLAFAGRHEAEAKETLFGFRGRMDERPDRVRSVRDDRYVYVRNYMPHRPYGAHVAYMFQTPTTQVWHRLYEEGKLPPEQAFFWEPTKPYEELYDLASDPYEVENLAGSPEHAATLSRLRKALDAHLRETVDVGFIPEAEMLALAGAGTPWDLARDSARYDLDAAMAAADVACRGKMSDIEALRGLLGHDDAVQRYWGALGALIRGSSGVLPLSAELVARLADPALSVRIVAAEALGRYGKPDHLQTSLEVLIDAASVYSQPVMVAVAALNSIDALDQRARPIADRLRRLPTDHDKISAKQDDYVPRLVERILSDS